MPVNRYEMNKQPTPSDNLVPVFTPPLIKLLQQKEKAKGTPLTRGEVLEIRDNATMILVNADEALKMTRRRGFADLDADRAWEQWKELRLRL